MRVLLIDDDDELASRIERQLVEGGSIVDRVGDGEDALAWPDPHLLDAIVLDLGLPSCDGFEFLQRWRQRGHRVPILVLSARSSWTDKVRCLDAGADDYMIKPAQPEELIARLKALCRRMTERPMTEWIEVSGIRLNPELKVVELNGEDVHLSATEFRLLKTLMRRGRAIVTQEDALAAIYPYGEERLPNTIEAYIARLRRKIGHDRILTMRGLGYKLA